MQVLPQDKVIELATMMKRVVDEGTAKRAQLPGIDVIGKTGTTNGYKDAWFCGYTGVMGGCVWYGNDDNEPMNNMTGGALPAGTWHDVIAYALQGVPVTPIVGLRPPTPVAGAPAAAVSAEPGQPQRPGMLSKAALQAIEAIQSKLRALDAKPAAPAPAQKQGAAAPVPAQAPTKAPAAVAAGATR
jgi:penicillin-binding protein 1A